jgi:hypothetical protein
MALLRSLYVSRPSDEIASGSDFDLTVADILATSRARNAQAGITGALLASHGCFMQALEGPAGAVTALMEGIERDPRHGAIRRMPDAHADRRLFADWSMYFGRLDQVDAALARAFAQDGPLDPFRMDPERLLAFLYSCAVAPSPSGTTLRLDRLIEPGSGRSGPSRSTLPRRPRP